MKGVRRFQDYLKIRLRSKAFRDSFDEEEVYAQVALQIAHLRIQKKFSQKKLAGLLHTTQQTVSRLEDPRNTRYSLQTLLRIASAFGKGLKIQFV